MNAPRRRASVSWGELLLTSGLAAGLTTIGSYAADRAKADRDAWSSRCAAAAGVLSDETPSPYMDEAAGRALARAAAQTLSRCMAEER